MHYVLKYITNITIMTIILVTHCICVINTWLPKVWPVTKN